MSVPSPPWSQRDESHPGAGLGCSATWEGTSDGTHSWTQGSSGPSSLAAFVPISSTVGGGGQPVSLPPLDPTHAKPNDASFHGNLAHLPSEVDRTPREESAFQGLVRKWTTSGLWGWGQTRSVSYMEVQERCLFCLPWLSHHVHPLAAGHMLHLDSDVHSKLTAG